jgi:aldehyde:ferredoxin oxidoreductase
LTEKELDKVGERIWNLARAIMILEGRTRNEDTLYKSYFYESNGQKGISKKDFEEAKTRYYTLRGWDIEKGWPSLEKLKEIDLGDIANDLDKMGFLNE